MRVRCTYTHTQSINIHKQRYDNFMHIHRIFAYVKRLQCILATTACYHRQRSSASQCLIAINTCSHDKRATNINKIGTARRIEVQNKTHTPKNLSDALANSKTAKGVHKNTDNPTKNTNTHTKCMEQRQKNQFPITHSSMRKQTHYTKSISRKMECKGIDSLHPPV